MDPVTSRVTEHIAEQSLQQGASGGAPTEVDHADQMQFEQALNGQQPGGPQDAGMQAIQPTESTLQSQQVGETQAGGKPSLGDSILNGIEKLKGNFDVRADRIEQTLVNSGGDMSMEEMMKLQFEVMQMGIEQDITTKMADKTSSGVQTMFRNQG
jgi:hypothetical protein